MSFWDKVEQREDQRPGVKRNEKHTTESSHRVVSAAGGPGFPNPPPATATRCPDCARPACTAWPQDGRPLRGEPGHAVSTHARAQACAVGLLRWVSVRSRATAAGPTGPRRKPVCAGREQKNRRKHHGGASFSIRTLVFLCRWARLPELAARLAPPPKAPRRTQGPRPPSCTSSTGTRRGSCQI